MLLSAVPGAFSAEATVNRNKGTEVRSFPILIIFSFHLLILLIFVQTSPFAPVIPVSFLLQQRHLRGNRNHQYAWCYDAAETTCRAVEACTWDSNGGCQPSRGAMKRAKDVAHFGPAPNFGPHHHRGPSISPPPPPPPFAGGPGGPPAPAFVCRSTTSPVACMHMNGCRLYGNRCDGAFAYDYEEFDSADFEFEAFPDEVDSADYDEEFDEEYYDEDEDEEDADIDMMDAENLKISPLCGCVFLLGRDMERSVSKGPLRLEHISNN